MPPVVKSDDDPHGRRAELQRLKMELDRLEESLRDTRSLDACERRIKELRRKINNYMLWRVID